MKYRSKPGEVEAMQWSGYSTREEAAEAVVAWVDANGGEARHEPATCGYLDGIIQDLPARIAVRTVNGWAYARPSHYVVMGGVMFKVRAEPERWLRDFYPCDPETFESRWEPTA